MESNDTVSEQGALNVLENVVQSSLSEQRKARRWGIFFKLLTFAYLAVLLGVFLYKGVGGEVSDAHIGVIEIKGVIAAEEMANANAVAGSLRQAFENEACEGVLLAINSPGGSPVQSGQIYDEIKRLRGAKPGSRIC